MNDASTKTFEGFLAFFVSTFATALLLASDGDEYSIGKIAIACVAAALSECTLESTLDNVVIPLVFLAFLYTSKSGTPLTNPRKNRNSPKNP